MNAIPRMNSSASSSGRSISLGVLTNRSFTWQSLQSTKNWAPRILVRATQGGPEFNEDERNVNASTRLNRSLRAVPRRINGYFSRRWDRQALWCFISFGSGYYVANSISLSFGALAINDVVAAAIMVTFYEFVSFYYFTSKTLSLRLLFLNWAKMGIVAGFIADALKLGG